MSDRRIVGLMIDRDQSALDAKRLVPRLLRGIENTDTHAEVAGLALEAPLLMVAPGLPAQPVAAPLIVPSDLLLEHPHLFDARQCIALLRIDSMGVLIKQVRALAGAGVAAVALDQSVLASSAPYGNQPWRPRSREELSELRAAAGVPFWLYGVGGADDADVALEAGLEAVVVDSRPGRHIGGPAVIEVLPEILDAVAGTMGVFAAGTVRDGIDVFRLLAVGADLVIHTGERPVSTLAAELQYAMRITGCASLSEIGFDAVFAPLFEEGRA